MGYFKDWLVINEELSDTQRIAAGGKNRAIRNDLAISYDPSTAAQASHKYSDEMLPDNIMPWIIAMQNRGNTPEQISAKLWKIKKIKASPETIRNKLNVERTRGEIEPTLRKAKLGDISQPTAQDDYINSYYTITPETKQLIDQWRNMRMPANVIHKKLKSMGINISYRTLLTTILGEQ